METPTITTIEPRLINDVMRFQMGVRTVGRLRQARNRFQAFGPDSSEVAA